METLDAARFVRAVESGLFEEQCGKPYIRYWLKDRFGPTDKVKLISIELDGYRIAAEWIGTGQYDWQSSFAHVPDEVKVKIALMIGDTE